MNLPATPDLTVQGLLAPGKGLLAADESLPTIGKRFAAINLPSTEESRRAWRELLFTTPALGEYTSGAILFEETLSQKSTAGVPFPEVLARQGIIPGIKVDTGTIPLPGYEGEKITQGLEGLEHRLATFRELGARFTKWRAVFAVGDGRPTADCLEANARALARFATLSQQAGLVPIVEPEVLMEGDHSLARCEDVTRAALTALFVALAEQQVDLATLLLKLGMVLPGQDCAQQAEVGTVSEATLRCLRAMVPAAVPGIVFLSGGQESIMATERLNAICGAGGVPWKISFSFGRALQDPAMGIWQGAPANQVAAQTALFHRAKCNGLAVRGRYSNEAERGI